MQANVKTKNGKSFKIKALVNLGCTHTRTDEQLVKEKSIQIKPINFSFKIFNTDGTKNREVTKMTPLKIEINRHKEQLEAAVTDLNRYISGSWLVSQAQSRSQLEEWNNKVHEMSRKLQNETSEYWV